MTPSQVTPGPKRREAAAAEGPPTRSGRKGEAAGNGSFEEMARSEAMAVCGTAGGEAMRRTFWLTPRQNERESEQRRRLVTMKRRPYRSDVEGNVHHMSTYSR